VSIHQTQIFKVTKYPGGRFSHALADCTCGWSSPKCPHLPAAQEAATKHIENPNEEKGT